MEIISKGDVKLESKTPWSNGTTHLLFTSGEFLEKLSALIPPPKLHLVRWGGVFAPSSPVRSHIILNKDEKKGFDFGGENDDESQNYSWSRMLAKVFKIDVTKCDSCGGELVKVSAVTSAQSVERYLSSIGIDFKPPARAPPRATQESFDYTDSEFPPDDLPVVTLD